MTVSVAGFERLLIADAFDTGELGGQQFIGLGFDPLGDIGVRRATVRRVVLETAAFRRVVRRRNHHAIGQPGSTATVVANNGVGNGRGRGVFIVRGNHGVDTIGGEDFQRTSTRRGGQGVGVDADEQRTIDPFELAVQANGLTDCQNMPLIEAQLKRAAAVPGCSKSDSLGGNRCIGLTGVVSGHQSRNIDQQLSWSRFARKRTECHAKPQKEMIRRKNRSLLALRHWREAIVLTQRINYVLSANSALYDGTICILFPLMAKIASSRCVCNVFTDAYV